VNLIKHKGVGRRQRGKKTKTQEEDKWSKGEFHKLFAADKNKDQIAPGLVSTEEGKGRRFYGGR